MTNDYNSVAGIYDWLSRLVFQKSIINAQKFLLKSLTPDNNILIVGGGAGWILKEIADANQQNIKITYVEKSVKMIALSKQKNCADIEVKFVWAAIEDFTTDAKFDIIITAFLFDNFKADKIELIFDKLNKYLKQGGIWLYADFMNNDKVWQQALLKIMYLFFRLTCNIETHQLLNMDKYFETAYIKTGEAFFYKNFIHAGIYKKIQLLF